MSTARLTVRSLAATLALPLFAGCVAPPGPIFPQVSPPIVWPPAPDTPRIRYVGELRGEASLGARPKGWQVFRELLAGPEPKVAFVRPTAVAVSGERVYVADVGLGGVHLLDLVTRGYLLMRGAPDDPLRVPIDLAIGNGQLVVVDRGRAALDIFDLAGTWRRTQRWPELKAPVAIAFDPNQCLWWLADAEAHACLATADLATFTRRIGQRGVGPGQFNYPTALACGPAGLVVADAMNFRIQLFDPAGLPVAVFGEKGDAAGTFSRPRGVALDSRGHIYVVDNQFENVQVFNASGELLMAFGGGGADPGQFSMPAGITIDARNRIWIADSLNRRVQVFQYLSERAGNE